MSDNPFARYAPRAQQSSEQSAAGSDNPFARYAPMSAPPEEEPGFLSRLWSGVTGGDVSRAGRMGMGLADPLYGLAQLAAHGNFGVPLTAVGPPGQAAQMQQTMGNAASEADRITAERQTRYEQGERAAGLEGGVSSEWPRFIGNVASPVNLTLGAAAAPVRGAPLLARAAGYGAGGAATALTEPTTEPDAYEPDQLAKRAGIGAVGGVVGGGIGEAIGSWIGRAIAGNNPRTIDEYVTSGYRNIVKPRGARNETQLAAQDQHVLSAFDDIIANRPNLTFTDPGGNVTQGVAPRSLRDFSQAIDQTRRTIFREYDDMARNAGVLVDLTPVVARLNAIARTPQVIDLHPNLATYAADQAQRFAARRHYTPSEAQDVIENINKTLDGFYRNPTDQSVTQAAILSPAVAELRAAVDRAITNSPVGAGWQQLRNRYGALAAIEKDVAGAVQREANKVPGGFGRVLNVASAAEALRGFSGSPEAFVTAAGLRAAKMWMRRANDPNAALVRLFARRAQPPAGPVRSAIGAAAETATPALGTVTGGTAAEDLRSSVAGP